MTISLRPTVLPDELDRSYLGRIMRLNNFPAEKVAVDAMSVYCGKGGMSRRELSSLEVLSLFADVPLERFAQLHSTIPLRRAITSSLPDLPHGSATRRSLLYSHGMIAIGPGASFCMQCAQNDLLKHGVSYWHREHQIPGRFWCGEHQSPLCSVPGEEAFLRSPLSFISTAESVPAEWVTAGQCSTCVNRFIEISSVLFARTMPLDVKFVALAFKERAALLGLNTVAAPVRGKPLLSDRIRASFPAPWLGTVFPDLIEKIEGKILNRVDGVLYMSNSASTVWPYLMAASVLYDTAQEAIQHMVEAQQKFMGRSKQRKRSDTVVDQATLVEKYIECKGHHALVAEGLELPLHAVVSLLREAGLPNLVYSRSERRKPRAAAEAFYIYEKSFEESTDIGGLVSSEMSSLVRGAGRQFRSALLAMGGGRPARGIGVRRTRRLTPLDAEKFIQDCKDRAITNTNRVEIDSMASGVDFHKINSRKMPVNRPDKFVMQGETEMV